MSFGELNLSPALLRNLARLGFDEPSPIQAQAIPTILEGRDVLGIARTGSGKTAGFALPILEVLLQSPRRGRAGVPGRAAEGRRGGPRGDAKHRKKVQVASTRAGGPRALVLCPTRELALQVASDFEALASGSTARVLAVHGKVSLAKQAEAIAEGIDVLVATPGRCIELLEAAALSLDSVRHLVLDEADRMLDMGFEAQLARILEAVPSDRQSLLFSATMPPEVERLAEAQLRHPIRVEVDPQGTPVGHVVQQAMRVLDDDKVPALLALLAGADRAEEGSEKIARTGVLVFCRTRRRAHWIGTALNRHGIHVGYLHGDRSHAQRQRALRDFGRGVVRTLVATDVAARGLHVPAVSTVVNYDVAVSPEEHVHRIGRAAHGLEGRGGAGSAITLLAPGDRTRWESVARATGVAVPVTKTPELTPYAARPSGGDRGADRADRDVDASAEREADLGASRRASVSRRSTERGAPDGRERDRDRQEAPSARPGAGSERRGGGSSRSPSEGAAPSTASAGSARSARSARSSGPKRSGGPNRSTRRSSSTGAPGAQEHARPQRSRAIGRGQKPGGGVRKLSDGRSGEDKPGTP